MRSPAGRAALLLPTLPLVPGALAQAPRQPSPGELAVFLVIFGVILVLLLGAIVAGTIWLWRDVQRRGENGALWLILAIVLALFTGFGWAILLLVWLLVRPKEVICDVHGNPLPGKEASYAAKKGIPPPSLPQWAPPGTAVPPDAATGAGLASPGDTQQAAWTPEGAAPPWTPLMPRGDRTKCPSCSEVFEYVKNPSGPSDVKCPRCGTEGTTA